MNNSLSKQKKDIIPAVSAVLVTAGVCLFALLRYRLSLSTNDDVTIKAILCGDITGTPDAHTIYMMYLPGLLLKGLYLLAGNIPWYDLFAFLIHIAGYYLVIYRTVSVFKGRQVILQALTALLSGMILTALDLPYLIFHQYTSLSAFVFCVSVFYLATKGSVEKENEVFSDVIIVSGLTLSLWIRKEAFLMGLPLVFLLMILRFGKGYLRRIRIPALVLAAVLVISFSAEHMAYSSEEWKEYKAYNAARTDVYDYYGVPDYSLAKELYDAADLRESDMYAFAEWDTALMPGFLKEALPGIAGESKKLWMNSHMKRWEIRRTIKGMMGEFAGNSAGLMGPLHITVLGTVFLFLLISKKKKAAVIVFLGAGFDLLFVAYFTFRQRFPERVSYGFFLMMVVFSVGILLREIIKSRGSKDRSNKERRVWVPFFIAFFMAAAAFLVLRVGETDERYAIKAQSNNEWAEINAYFEGNEDKIYYIRTKSFAPYGEWMFKPHTFERNNYLRLSSWIMGSPLYEVQLKERGEKPWESLIWNENVYLVQMSDVGTGWIESLYAGRGIPVKVTETGRIRLSEQKEAVVFSVRP